MLKQRSHHFSHLTRADIDSLVSRFMSNPDDLTTNTPFFEAFHILEDVKRGKFQNAHYRLQDAEKLIYLATELNYTKRADDLLTETIKKWNKVSMATFEAVIRVLSKNKQQDRIDFWLSHIQKMKLLPTRNVVSSVISCKVATNQLDAAVHFLKRNCSDQDLAQLVKRQKRYLDAAQTVSVEVEKLVPDLKPNLARTALRALFSLAAQTGRVDICEKALELNKRFDLSLTHIGLSSLIACYLNKGDVQSAKSTFKTVASHTNGPDVIDFNLLMRTTVMENKAAAYSKILDILTHMKLVSVVPDLSTMRTMLSSYDSSSNMRDSLYDKLLKSPTASQADQVYLNNIAITNLLPKKGIQKMTGLLLRNNRGELFPGQETQRIAVDGMTFKILLDAATADTKYANIAEKLFKSMRSRGMKPEKQVYENLITILARKGKIQKARKYITRMEHETGYKADVDTYTKLVDGLVGLGKPHLAKEIIVQDMPLNNIPINSTVIQKLKLIESKLSSSNHSDSSM
ncbi:hypothetical protein BD408DRAFT_482945 [Parasitella parasitica]|nr:hypothetical protein BD408DRAFT_482945 [Parasitella parasitica]